ncbi:MAG: hypothetical protein ABII00_04870 [Elusimicrobiota bacterium]
MVRRDSPRRGRPWPLLLALSIAAGLTAGGSVSASWKDVLKKASKKVEKTRAEKRLRRTDTKAVAAVRGLEEGGCRAVDPGARDFEGLEWLEGFEIPEADVARFVREGRLAR